MRGRVLKVSVNGEPEIHCLTLTLSERKRYIRLLNSHVVEQSPNDPSWRILSILDHPASLPKPGNRCVLKSIDPFPMTEALFDEHESNDAFPAIWRLGGRWMSRKNRKLIYEPHVNELMLDFEETKEDYESPAARRWLQFCYGIRTVGATLRCIHYSIQDGVLGYLGSFLPAPWRIWLKGVLGLGIQTGESEGFESDDGHGI